MLVSLRPLFGVPFVVANALIRLIVLMPIGRVRAIAHGRRSTSMPAGEIAA